MALAHQQCVGQRVRSASASSTAPTGMTRVRRRGRMRGHRRAGAKHVDDHGDAARSAGAGDVVDDLNPHAGARCALSVTILARGMKLKSVAEAAV